MLSDAVPIPVIQILQVVTIAGAAPGVSGVIARVEARLQGRRGPRVLQPYYDLAKLFRKEALAPEGASWVFLAVPVAAFTCQASISSAHHGSALGKGLVYRELFGLTGAGSL